MSSMPGAADFNKAMYRWDRNGRVTDPCLQDGRPVIVKGILPAPFAMNGSFAVVYRLIDCQDRPVVIRCFKTEVPADIRTRYAEIDVAFAKRLWMWTVPTRLHDPGLAVAASDGTETEFPILQMEWVEGAPLNQWCHEKVVAGDQTALEQMCQRWYALAACLRDADIAHCDLSALNVLVRPDGSPVLIDYDEVFVGALAGTRSTASKGTPGFQHPHFFGVGGKEQRPYDTQADDFSALVIATALRALVVRPQLWHATVKVDSDGEVQTQHLLFRQTDLNDPDKPDQPDDPNLFTQLEGTSDAQLTTLVGQLKAACKGILAAVTPYFPWPAPAPVRELKDAIHRSDDRAISRVVRTHGTELIREPRVTEAHWRRVGQARRREQARAAVASARSDRAAAVRAWLQYGSVPDGPISWAPDDPRLTDLLDRLASASSTRTV